MVVIKSLRRALGLLADQPVLFVPFAAYGVLQVPQLFIETLDPTLAAVGSLLFSVPLLFCGTGAKTSPFRAGIQRRHRQIYTGTDRL